MKQGELFNRLMVKLRDFIIFRNHRGKAWTGKAHLEKKTNTVIIKNPRFYEFGLTPGASDMIGWRKITITQDMIGQEFAQFAAIEGKTKYDKLSKEQLIFLNNVKKYGGYAAVAQEKDGEILLHTDFSNIKKRV